MEGHTDTHRHKWTLRQTFLHIGLSDLENKFQMWVFKCKQTLDTTHQKGKHFSQAFV